MKGNIEVNSLIKVNNNNIFYKIKRFFKDLLKKENKESLLQTENTADAYKKINEQKNAFMESITNIENEETKLLKLQKQYKERKIKAKDLTLEQIDSLCALYKKQNEELKKSNKIRKEKLLQYRRKLQIDN